MGKVCARNRSDIFVINANLLKSETDSPLGYRLKHDVFGVHGMDQMQVDSTCIVVNLPGSLLKKFDFWPICPDNFKLKPDKPEVEKEALVKAKKRVDQSCSSRYDGQVKKHRVVDESDDSDSEDY